MAQFVALATVMLRYNFLVGTFNVPHLYTLQLDLSSASPSLDITQRSSATGPHSWLALSKDKKILYATAWTTLPSLASYTIKDEFGTKLDKINSVQTAESSGYVTCSDRIIYSAGGATGEVVSIDPATGGFGNLIQNLSFVEADHGSGGMRYGAHSAVLSPDERALYIADIGRNCIWTYLVNADGSLRLGEKHISPRFDGGPRHIFPHPSGKYIYSLEEHSSMVDIYSVENGIYLTHLQGVKIIPESKNASYYWADEVRLSLSNFDSPRYLFASTRGLAKATKGYVAVFALNVEGTFENLTPLDIWETPTSGGSANAIQLGPVGWNRISCNDGF